MRYLHNRLHVLHIYFSCHLNKILANVYMHLPYNYYYTNIDVALADAYYTTQIGRASCRERV